LGVFCAVASTGTGDQVMTFGPSYNTSTHFATPVVYGSPQAWIKT
jgi:hypothetical protein